MARRRPPPEFHRRALELIASGCKVVDVASRPRAGYQSLCSLDVDPLIEKLLVSGSVTIVLTSACL